MKTIDTAKSRPSRTVCNNALFWLLVAGGTFGGVGFGILIGLRLGALGS